MRCVSLRVWTTVLLAWDVFREESSVWAPGSNRVPTITTPPWRRIPRRLPHLVPMMTHFLTSVPNCWMLDDSRQKYWWPTRSTWPWLRLSQKALSIYAGGNWFSPSLSHQRLLLFVCDAIQLHRSESPLKTPAVPYTLTLSMPVNMQRSGKKRCDEQRVLIKPPLPSPQVLFKLKPSVNKYESWLLWRISP